MIESRDAAIISLMISHDMDIDEFVMFDSSSLGISCHISGLAIALRMRCP